MTDKSKLGKLNKSRGNIGERYYVKQFKDLGYTHCKTAREGSKLLDSCGIDLIFIPYNVQIKVGTQKGLNASKELKYIKDNIDTKLPKDSQESGYPKILIHKKPVGRGNKRSEFGEIVSMTFEDFKKIISNSK